MKRPRLYFVSLFICFFSVLSIAQVPESAKEKRFKELYNQATIDKQASKLEASAQALEEAKEIGLEIYGLKDVRYLDVLTRIADLNIDKGDFETAKKGLIEVEQLSLNLDTLGFKLQNNLFKSFATLYWYSGAYEASEVYYLKNKTLLEKNGRAKTEDYGSLLSNMAVLYWGLGDLVQMEAYLLESKALLAEVVGRNSRPYANVINNLAIFYSSTNQYQKAAPLYEEAQAVLKTLMGTEHPAYASVRNNLALLYVDLKQYNKAKNLYKEALKAIESSIGQETEDYARTLQNLAAVSVELKAYELAKKQYTKALEIQENVFGKTHIEYIRTLGNYSKLLFVEEKYEALNRVLEQANAHWDSHEKGTLDHLSVLEKLGTAKLFLNALDTAMDLCKEGYELNGFKEAKSLNLSTLISRLPSQIFRFEDYGVLQTELLLEICAAYYEKTKDEIWLAHQQAISVAMLEYISRAKSNYSTEEDLLVLLENSTTFVERTCATALLINDAERIQTAFKNSEQNKAILLSSALKSQRSKNFGNLPDSILQKERLFKEELDALKKQLAVVGKEEKGTLNTSLNDLNVRIDAFNEQLKTAYPDYYQLKYASSNVEVQELQAYLEEDALMIEYVVGKDSVYAFGLTKNGLQLYTLDVSKKELTIQVRKMRKALSNYNFILKEKNKAYQLYTKTAYWFYQKMMEPMLRDKSKIRQLILIPDGELAHLPFEAFLTKNAAQSNLGYQDLDYLMRTYAINYNYSASLWKENKEAKEFDNNGKMLAFAAAYEATAEEGELNRAPHLKKLRKILIDLPAVQTEVQQLESIFEGDFLYKEAATERNFKEKASDYAIIHLAMHGILNTQYPILSSMAFTENKDSLEDNFLEAHEISRLSLQAELVVLSACETGYGKFKQGEGVLSLARSFMYSGVPSMVVSLWQVNDGSTAIIMQLFYQNLQAGMNKAEALNRAKLAYIEQATGASAHPAFWAPFIQLGDSQALHTSRIRGGYFLWIGIVVLSILLILGGAYYRNRTL